MRQISTLVALVLTLALCGLVTAAPAPLPRKQKPVAGGVAGAWTVRWNSSVSVMVFEPNGNYRHDYNDTMWGGWWCMGGKTIYVVERASTGHEWKNWSVKFGSGKLSVSGDHGDCRLEFLGRTACPD